MPSHEAQLILSCKGTGTAEVNKFNSALVQADKTAEKVKQSISGLISTAAMLKFGKTSVQMFATQEKAVLMLQSALRNQGAAYNTLTKDLMAYNAEIQKQTIYGDEQIALLQAQGLNMGINASQIKEATRAAIGLSAAYNMNLGTAMMLIARASQGQTQMLTRYGIVLGENLTPQEKFAKLLEIGANKMQVAKDQAKTFEGAIQQMNNAVGDAREKIGAVFAPAITTLAGSLKGVSEMFSKLPEPVQRVIVMTGALTTGMTALRTALNLKAIAENLATGSSIAHTGAMAQSVVAARQQQASMQAMADYASRLNAQEIERAGLAKNVNLAIADRTKGYEALISAEQKVSRIESKVAEAQKGYQEALSIWKMDTSDKFATEDVKFQVENLNKLNAQLAVAKGNVAKLETAYIGMGKAVDEARIAQSQFNTARREEKKNIRNVEENRAAQTARLRALRQGKSVLEANAAAENAYAAVVAKNATQANLHVQAEQLKNAALAKGATLKQADAVASEFLANENKKAALSSTMFGRAQLSVRAGLTGMKSAAVAAGTAIKSMMVSMLPMLALSAGVELFMNLANRSKREAERNIDIATRENEKLQERIQLNQKEREDDLNKMKRYEELARLSDRTTMEHQELLRLTKELNGSYEGLNIPLLRQNEILAETGKLWDNISEKQKKRILEEKRANYDAEMRHFQAIIKQSYETLHGAFDLDGYGLNLYQVLESSQFYGGKTRDDIILSRLNSFSKMVAKKGSAEEYKAVLNVIDQYEKMIKLQKEYNDLLNKGKKGNNDKFDRERALKDAEKAISEYQNEKNFSGQNNEEKFKILTEKEKILTQEIKTLENNIKNNEDMEKFIQLNKKLIDIKSQISKITSDDVDKQVSTEKEIYDLAKRYHEKKKQFLFDELSNEQKLLVLKDRERDIEVEISKEKNKEDANIRNVIELENELLDITRQKKSIENSIAAKKRQEQDRITEASISIWKELYNAGRSFRETANSAIEAYSEAGIKLQSRMMFMPKNDPQIRESKKTNENLDEINKKLDSYNSEVKKSTEALKKISENFAFTSY